MGPAMVEFVAPGLRISEVLFVMAVLASEPETVPSPSCRMPLLMVVVPV